MRGIFISGTDTGVGKTIVSAGLLRLVSEFSKAHYWKPVQTGCEIDDDAQTVGELSGVKSDFLIPPIYRFKAPLSPHLAALKEEAEIEPRVLHERAKQYLSQSGFLIVEGAGGLLVPFAPKFLQIDFLKTLEVAVLLVVHNRLGAINHTLLTLEACRTRQIPVLGVLLNLTQDENLDGNGPSIEEFGGASVIAEFGKYGRPEELVYAIASHQEMRRSFRDFLRS